MDGHYGCLHILPIVSNVSRNLGGQIFFDVLFLFHLDKNLKHGFAVFSFFPYRVPSNIFAPKFTRQLGRITLLPTVLEYFS